MQGACFSICELFKGIDCKQLIVDVSNNGDLKHSFAEQEFTAASLKDCKQLSGDVSNNDGLKHTFAKQEITAACTWESQSSKS